MKSILTTLLSFAVTLFTAMPAYSQEHVTIKGKVLFENQPVSGASVALLNGKDSSLVKILVSDDAGVFSFTTVNGKYIIHTTAIGYAPDYTEADLIEENIIRLEKSAESLNEVIVVGGKPLVEMKADKMVVNVGASPSNSGINALELLGRSPGVSVDQNDNISIRGKQGVLVYLNGRQTYMSGEDLANMLKAMSADEIETLEIITQPSAKYDAAGNSGIINIVTKKSRKSGMNGSVSAGFHQGVYPKANSNFNLNYKKGKTNIFTSGSFTNWNNFQIQEFSRRFKQTAEDYRFEQESFSKSSSHYYNLRLGIDHQFNPQTSLAFNINGTRSSWANKAKTDGILFKDGSSAIDSTMFTSNNFKRTWDNLTTNVNLKRSFGSSDYYITVDADYLNYSLEQDQLTRNYTYYPNLPEYAYFLRAVLPTNIHILSGKIDYSKPLAEGTVLEAGVKSSSVETDNNAPYEMFDFDNNKWVDDKRKDHFVYKEDIHAGYVSVRKSLNKWSFQAGLRGEYTVSKGTQVLIKNSVERDYFQLFPTAYISYSMNEQHAFNFNYGRRIDRPNYRDLNPFQYFIDLYTYNQGNPYLNPQITNSIEIGHAFKGKLITSLAYHHTSDIINDILKQNDATKVTYQTKENVASSDDISLGINYNNQFFGSRLTSNFNVNLQYSSYDGVVNNAPLEINNTSLRFSTSQVVRFGQTWTADLNAFYQSKTLLTGVFVLQPIYIASFGVGKDIMKKKASIKLTVNDPFKWQKVKVDVLHDNINMLIRNDSDIRRVGLTFTYRFSKGEKVGQQRRTGSSAEEQSRITSEQ